MSSRCLLVMLLPATLLGMGFPLVLRIGARTLKHLGSEVGALYLFNSFGCIVGSLLAGFVLVPRLGSELTLRVTAAVSILLGLLVPRLIARAPRSRWSCPRRPASCSASTRRPTRPRPRRGTRQAAGR